MYIGPTGQVNKDDKTKVKVGFSNRMNWRQDTMSLKDFILVFPEFNFADTGMCGPRQAKTCLRAYVKCADSHLSAHAQGVIWVFALH